VMDVAELLWEASSKKSAAIDQTNNSDDERCTAND